MARVRQPHWHLGEILIKNGWATWEQLDEALQIQRSTRQILGQILIDNQFVTPKNLCQALAIQYDMPFVDFSKITIPSSVIDLVPKHIAYEHKTIPLASQGGILLIAISDPKDVKAETEVALRNSSYEVRAALGILGDILKAIRTYYGAP